ncbi:MAG TPA: amidohydrolase [Candidatus Acidoferrales bacterium]|nr:amidohydrolase [Candidatus Acidoferrales bacterium]
MKTETTRNKRKAWRQGILAAAGAAALAAVAGLGPLGAAPARRIADTILYNGRIVTVDRNFSYAQALAVAGDRILAAGDNKAMRRFTGPHTRRIDLRGRTVIPGLEDDHLHAAGGGPGVDLSKARTMQKLLDAISARVRQAKAGEIVITNSDWHEDQLKEQRLPLRDDLDKIAPHTPVVVVRGGHEYVLNSAALAKWNITPSTPTPSGGAVSRYPDGRLNGELVDSAKQLVHLPPPPPEDMEARIRARVAEYQKLNAAGLTGVRHPGAPIEDYRMLQEMQRRGLLTLRVNFLAGLFGSRTAENVRDTILSWHVQPMEGDDWVRLWGVKMLVDGGFEGGWMKQPYAEPYGKHGTYFGLNVVKPAVYTPMVEEANRQGFRVATHAVGDAAIGEVLDAYEAANREKSIVGHRWSIEHAFVPDPGDYARINRLGLVVSAQDHLYLAGPSLKRYWGAERAEFVTPMRSYLDHQVRLAAGTDSPVIPYEPLLVIYHFVTRDTISGGVFGADQRISRQEALRASTMGNAYLDFTEDREGSLEPGKYADLVVLSGDIMTCPAEQIPRLTVLMTMVGGRIVYRNPGFRP